MWAVVSVQVSAPLLGYSWELLWVHRRGHTWELQWELLWELQWELLMEQVLALVRELWWAML